MMPKWAQELVINALLYLEGKGFRAELPDIRWRHGSANDSSGTCVYNRYIVITAGKSRRDARLVLLHEVAHWVTGNEGHSDNFWRMAFDLFRWNKLSLRQCLAREGQTPAHRSVKRLKRLAQGVK